MMQAPKHEIFMLNWEIFELTKKLKAFANVYSIIDIWTVDCLSQLIATVDAIMTAGSVKTYGDWDKKDAKIFQEYYLHHSINCKKCGRAVKITQPSLLKHLKECDSKANGSISKKELIKEVLEITLGVPRKIKPGPSQSNSTIASAQSHLKRVEIQNIPDEQSGRGRRRNRKKRNSVEQTKQETSSQSTSTVASKQNHPKQVDNQNKPNEQTNGSKERRKGKSDPLQQALLTLSINTISPQASSSGASKQIDNTKQTTQNSKKTVTAPEQTPSKLVQNAKNDTVLQKQRKDSSPKRKVHRPNRAKDGEYVTKGSIPKGTVELTKKTKNFLKNVKPQSLLTNGDLRRKELANSPAHDSIVESLESLFKADYPKVKAYPFGSRITGLGKESSDLDIYLDLEGNYDGSLKYSKDKLKSCVLRTEMYLERSDQWDKLDPVTAARTPIIRAWNTKQKIDCDISFTHGLSHSNTKLIQYLFDLQPVCFYVALYAKEWSRKFSMDGLNTYTLVLLTVFYFQKENRLPCVHSLQKSSKDPMFISHWQANFERKSLEELQISQIPETEAEKHIWQFFSFYGSKFCFDTRVVCPFLGWAPQKEDFDPFDCDFPLEMHNLQKYYNNIDLREAHPVNDLLSYMKPMVVQDPFELNHNVAKGIRPDDVNRFRTFCAQTAEMLRDVLEETT